MLSNVRDVNGDGDEDSYNGRLLKEIKEISKAIYLQKTSSNSLISQFDDRTTFNGNRTLLVRSQLDPDKQALNDNVVHKGKKPSSLWNWKKPLKALAHIRQHKFKICFFLHVHSVEGLQSDFDDNRLVVHWKRRNEELCTQPSKISCGIAEFEETLVHKCSVYGSKSGRHNSAKYELDLFLIYVSVVGVPRVDIGKHWIDLTKLLPLTLEDLEDVKSSGKLTTSFKLSGRANGATLNVSYGFSMIENNLAESLVSDNLVSFDSLNSAQLSSGTLETNANFLVSNSNKMHRRVGSVPSNLEYWSSLYTQSTDEKVSNQAVSDLGLEFPKWIHSLYQKLDEGSLDRSVGDSFLGHLEEPKPVANEPENIEIVVAKEGEIFMDEEFKSEESTLLTIDSSAVEIIDVNEMFKDEEIGLDQQTEYVAGIVIDDWKHESTLEELDSALSSQLFSESSDVESSSATYDAIEQATYVDAKSCYRATKTTKKSLSLDDITDSVASDFLNMLGIDHDPFSYNSDSEPESPRERLLRQFEKEALASGDYILHFGSISSTGSSCGNSDENFEFCSSLQVAEGERESKSQFLRYKRKVKLLEDLETEALMEDCGLDDNFFVNSRSGGFGSPIELSFEEPVKLHSMADYFGPIVRTKGGGFLRSMNPLLFEEGKYDSKLIIQASVPVVLPAGLGSDIMWKLQSLASIGIHKLSLMMNALMPLEDLKGKTIEQVLEDNILRTAMSKREASFQQASFNSRESGEGFEYNLSLDRVGGDESSGYVSLEGLAPLAMNKIEFLALEGLRIQCGMSNKEPPSSVGTLVDNANDVAELLGCLLTLDEWLRQDAGIIDDEHQTKGNTTKVLDECVDLASDPLETHVESHEDSAERRGLSGDNLTIALMVLLRDPLCDYDQVGASMLVLLQVERGLFVPKPKMLNNKEEEDNESISKDNEASTPLFKITGVHLAGLNTEPEREQPWATKTQQQYGTSWLLGNSMSKYPCSNSEAIVSACPEASRKPLAEDVLWSITFDDGSTGSDWKELASLPPHLRNPNVIFPEEKTVSSVVI